ncbi:SUMF1/EgtB/PvdO family nonheme iron enzyme [Bacteroidales bacterium OttesenSCG-928-B11]|nr:SUMF1/EgtB/PvdO family nonheme iron enzyme [Bacteroidales bacterium OttesenSCG-928-C03]MDL2311706.1 SUMF1/EgtB/PvdO family nonheme iron enzyme [Bacteroidales bacterium OttesenSCG-928-B11]MDL2325899.1 SUMF1/EgtB/PvdO family nonheme iron enzyme [Bacteroidales bacterium OttesenSCG-928-A14]
MKKIAVIAVIALLFASSCSNKGDGQLVGVKDRPSVLDLTPFGMVYVPAGHYLMGAGDQDVPYAYTNQSKSVTIEAFWMDQTEITNNEYRQFVYWVRDSIAHVLLGEAQIEDAEKYGHYLKYKKGENEGEEIEPKLINWDEKIPWDSDNEEVQEALSPMFNKVTTRYYHYKPTGLNTSMMNYEYWETDYRNYRDPKDPEVYGASYKEFDKEGYEYGGMYANRPSSVGQGAHRFNRHEVVNIYPDTLCWAHDFTYSYNEPSVLNYFANPNYDNYPVVGVSWIQARAFCHWRTHIRNVWLLSNDYEEEHVFRLPTEAEWEWSARGELLVSPYPWGGPYTSNENGCFLSNFKPQRGNYIADGYTKTAIVGYYHPNDFGLFDMSGNVAEWCDDAFDKSSVNFTHDLNSHYRYYARKDDTPEKKRKVIRGGSWKDISFYTTVYKKDYEYQDTCKSYIGFRCVQSYMGPHRGEVGKSSHVY